MCQIRIFFKACIEKGGVELTKCKYCPAEVFFNSVNGHSLLFEDAGLTILHVCPGLKKFYNNNDDHVLLTKTISRVSRLEREFDDLKKKLGVDKNEI